MQILFTIFVYFIAMLDVNGAAKFDTLVYPLMFKTNSINYGKLNYYNPPDVKLTDDTFKTPEKNINRRKQVVSAQRMTPTSTMTIISLLNGFKGGNEYTTSTPIEEPIPIIEYTEPINKKRSGKKRTANAGKTIGELLWGNQNSMSLPLNEQKPIVSPPVIKSKHHRQSYIINKLKEKENLQQYLIHPGYDYDDTICKIINKRLLCGYNKNLGKIHDETAYINLQGDCRMRDDRIECGYSGGTQNLNYEPYSNTIYRTRPDQGDNDNTPPPPTNNRDNLDMLRKLAATYDPHQNIRSSNLRNGNVDFY
ncbi:uncharacterized protein LOC113230881 [Hyposmocoma kahamanoa]|uniref:uncharacterized protein LOC113230881 n=1 Tax=Hyposmocoma kahamanoa TaxID=1477025 RepID=UPI000E6D6A4D|nr:uncharacterized protein LOC113230881 [Hyposmocoma kahamanoa]